MLKYRQQFPFTKLFALGLREPCFFYATTPSESYFSDVSANGFAGLDTDLKCFT